MRIAPGAEIAGIRVSDIKRTLSACDMGLDSATLGYQLGLLEPRLSRALTGLAEAGLIAHTGQVSGVDQWGIAPAGQRLLASRINKPISRERGRELLDQVIAAARQVNASHGLAFCVTEITVFGSYLGNSPDLGDLDIAVSLGKRPSTPGRDLHAEARARAPARADDFVWATWPRLEVLRYLQVHPKYVALHEGEQPGELGARHQAVYAYDPQSGCEAPVSGEIRTPTASHPDAGLDDASAGGTPACRACTNPQEPPYDPARAVVRPRRFGRCERRGAPASREEIAAQNAWANGLSVAEILSQHALSQNNVRALTDLIVALYRWSEEPDRSPVCDCTPSGGDSFLDPNLGVDRTASGRVQRHVRRVRKVPYAGDIRLRATPRRIEHIDAVLARALASAPCPAQLQVTLRSSADTSDGWYVGVSIHEDDWDSFLVLTPDSRRTGGLRWLDAADQTWADIGRQVHKELATWLARLTAALGAGIECTYWTDTDQLAAANSRPEARARQLSTQPLMQTFAEQIETHPKVRERIAPDSRLVAHLSPTPIGMAYTSLRLIPREPDNSPMIREGTGIANIGVTQPLGQAFERWWRDAPEVLRDLQGVSIRLPADRPPTKSPEMAHQD